MRKISGHVVSTKATTLSRAADIVSSFAAVDNGSSPAVAVYLQRTAEAFNHLVQFHGKRSKLKNLQSSPKLPTNATERRLKGDEDKDSENKVRKKEKKLKGDEAEDVEISVKKKKKRKSDDGDGDIKEKSSRRKKGKAAVDS